MKIFKICVLVHGFSSANGWRSFVVLFENVTVSSDPDWATVDAKIEESDGNSVLNLHINILKMITKPTIRGYLRFDSMSEDETDDDQSHFIEIVNKTTNICQLTNLKALLPVVHLSFADLNKFGTMLTSSPIRKQHYFIQNFKIDEERMPSYLPETNFLTEIQIYGRFKNKTKIYVGITLTGRLDKSKMINDFKLFAIGNH